MQLSTVNIIESCETFMFFLNLLYNYLRPYILTWTDYIDKDLKPSIALSNFSQNGPWAVMFESFVFTRFSL